MNGKASLLLTSVLFIFLSCQQDIPGTQGPLHAEFILAKNELPAYELELDHAHYLQNWSKEFYHKGLVTYRTVCFNCHGDKDQPGSIPNSTKFWQDSFKYGSDPYSMYQTLTQGVGLMAPQVNLSPQEKYGVIHFIREEFMRDHNPNQFKKIDSLYLGSLPRGDSLGPDPQEYKPWAEMDYGNFLMYTYELSDSTAPERIISRGRSPLANEDYQDVNFAYRGIAIRLDPGPGGVAAGKAFVLFDLDLFRLVGFWTGEGFIDYRSILLNDEHNIYPRTVGKIQFENDIMPGWANPETGDFKDPRFVAVDGRAFGPLPKTWAHFKGLYVHKEKVILNYSVGDAEVLEMFELERMESTPLISRTIKVTPSSKELTLFIGDDRVEFGTVGQGGQLDKIDDKWLLFIPENTAINIRLTLQAKSSSGETFKVGPPEDIAQYIKGGKALYADQVLTTPIIKGNRSVAYEVDVLTLPQTNPWKSRMRPTGIDFINDGEEAIVCTIDGEVWRVEGITQQEGLLKWHRIATGLFQPLGIKYHQGEIYVGCRDQIVKLKDLNGDGETDFYESFNNDHQVTEHFHEFAMGLQTDDEGNFYYAKSGRHARTSLVPQHGTLIKVTSDGSASEILANGFRAANGVCLNPDGSFYVTDQEGYWNPMNRINRVTKGGFYGNMYGYNPPKDSSDEAMVQPMMWVDMKYDRSPAELLWAESDRWGPLNGSLLNLSYGYGKVFVVYPQIVNGVQQGSMIELPVAQFPTGIMRARFNQKDGQFYGCGMSAWATNQMIQVGGLYRIRYTGKPLHIPIQVNVFKEGVELIFDEALNDNIAMLPDSYTINTWDLKRTRNYGSKRYNEQKLEVNKITISDDRKTVLIHLPNIKPTWVMEVLYRLESERGHSFEGALQNTIYNLASNDNSMLWRSSE